jgi:hypothetical protein
MALSLRKRFAIFNRDRFTCRYCGRKAPDVQLEVDHITPVSAGGSDEPANLTTACFDCNRGKSARRVSTSDYGGYWPYDTKIVVDPLDYQPLLPKSFPATATRMEARHIATGVANRWPLLYAAVCEAAEVAFENEYGGELARIEDSYSGQFYDQPEDPEYPDA